MDLTASFARMDDAAGRAATASHLDRIIARQKREDAAAVEPLTLQAGHAYKLRSYSTFRRYVRIFCVGTDGDGNQRAYGVYVHFDQDDGHEYLESGDWEMNGLFYSATGPSGLDLVEHLGTIEQAL